MSSQTYLLENLPYPTNLSISILSALLSNLSIFSPSKSLMKYRFFSLDSPYSLINRFCLFWEILSVNPLEQETKLLTQDSLKFWSIISNNTPPKMASGHSAIFSEDILLLHLNSAINISLSSWRKSLLSKTNKTLKFPKIVFGSWLNLLKKMLWLLISCNMRVICFAYWMSLGNSFAWKIS